MGGTDECSRPHDLTVDCQFDCRHRGYWLSQPCWQVTGYHFFRFAGKNEVSKELFSFACDLNQTQLTWETHDWRTGKLVRSLPLDVPAKRDYIGVLDVPTSGDTEDSILVLAERHQPTNGNLTSYLLDAATGKRLSDKPIEDWVSTSFIARHQSQLALSLKNELRLFRDKHDPGRSITFPRVKTISFSPDGKTLACVDRNAQLTLIDFATGNVRGSKNITGHIEIAQFVSNDELMVFISGPQRGTGVTVTRWQLDESDCRQISQPVLLPMDQLMGLNQVPVIEKKQDRWVIPIYWDSDWPVGLDGLCDWLTQKGYRVSSMINKQSFVYCFELTASNEIVAKYRRYCDGSIPLGEDRAAYYLPATIMPKSLEVVRTQSIWPWSLGIGTVAYGLMWLLFRKKTKQLQVHDALTR